MKHIKFSIILFVCLLPLTLIAQQQKYTVRAKVGRLQPPAIAYLFVDDKIDSMVIRNGEFRFSGSVSEVQPATILISYDGVGQYDDEPEAMPSILNFYLEPGEISVISADSLENAKVTGGTVQADYSRLLHQLKSNYEVLNRFNNEFNSASEEQKASSEYIQNSDKQLAAIGSEQMDIYRKFIKDNPGSLMSLFVLECYAKYGSVTLLNASFISPELSEIEALYNSLDAKVRSSKQGIEFYKLMKKGVKVEIGNVAPDFEQPDTAGNLVSLRDFRGKYVLIDFWASWCGPCREENPFVVEAYNEYQSKGFTVLGVSLDAGDKELWLEAIYEDGLAWNHVSDLKGWKNEVALLYSVKSVPQNYLLDPEGVVVAINLRGEDLKRKLAELIK
ncbi:TlpA disulfide reductase family protein [Chitinophaga sp. XS-30]|uniref:TlpA disulfide reductase family protein n=1 Tax=Chitinophaga sp. XS-30 TaxID=2604421 RepID=UPI0011DE4638|nr:TlpA disulfide reductase family protein [Chitinophaga sp. XS-30]QEH39561.1 AhpC/TSA family protein [Chitinophaga sp. XS-30]